MSPASFVARVESGRNLGVFTTRPPTVIETSLNRHIGQTYPRAGDIPASARDTPSPWKRRVPLRERYASAYIEAGPEMCRNGTGD